jgi:hypothetical protein
MRALESEMFRDLKDSNGCLHGLLNLVLQDTTLEFEMRGARSASIYYRGGSMLRIEWDGTQYVLHFDTNYCSHGQNLSEQPSIAEAIEKAPYYKQAMDRWFAQHPKYEREVQQIVERDNNRHGKISHATDYYIVDTEFVYKDARFDMVAVHWPSIGAVRKNLHAPKLAFIEMKYGDGALSGTAGLMKHLKDFEHFRQTADLLAICDDYAKVFRQKCALGLIPDMKDLPHDITIQSKDIALIFLLANHDPEKNGLRTIVTGLQPTNYPFPVKFAAASMMGFGLYDEMMYSVDEFQTYLSRISLRRR